MDLNRFARHSDYEWEIRMHGAMRVRALIFASEALIRSMDEKVYEQSVNVAALPGIVKASYVMPDAHWGYGFPIGGVAAFDPDKGGVISAGGVGFDRKGPTRAFGPCHPDLPEPLRQAGQPVLIGGSMGTGSYVLAGTAGSETRAFSSASHGAGRSAV
jgi:RNA-splicing ligase RtcB